MGKAWTDLAIAFLHIIAELCAVAGGVQPVLKHIVGIWAVVSSHARLILHKFRTPVSQPKAVRVLQSCPMVLGMLPVMQNPTHTLSECVQLPYLSIFIYIYINMCT